MAIEEGDDAEHILVVFIIAHRLAIGFKKRHIFLLRKCFGEFVDVHRFVVLVHILIVERGLGHEVHDMVVGIDAHHSAIHPRFIFSHESQVGEGVIHQLMEHFIVENQVAFYQQCVVGLQRIFGERQRVDVVGFVKHGVHHIFNFQSPIIVAHIVHEFLGFVAHHHHHPREVKVRKLAEHAVDEFLSVHFHHTLGVLLCVFAEAFAHSGGKNDGLHINSFFSFFE